MALLIVAAKASIFKSVDTFLRNPNWLYVGVCVCTAYVLGIPLITPYFIPSEAESDSVSINSEFQFFHQAGSKQVPAVRLLSARLCAGRRVYVGTGIQT